MHRPSVLGPKKAYPKLSTGFEAGLDVSTRSTRMETSCVITGQHVWRCNLFSFLFLFNFPPCFHYSCVFLHFCFTLPLSCFFFEFRWPLHETKIDYFSGVFKVSLHFSRPHFLAQCCMMTMPLIRGFPTPHPDLSPLFFAAGLLFGFWALLEGFEQDGHLASKMLTFFFE